MENESENVVPFSGHFEVIIGVIFRSNLLVIDKVGQEIAQLSYITVMTQFYLYSKFLQGVDFLSISLRRNYC